MVHVLSIFEYFMNSFQIKTLLQVITYSGEPEFRIIGSLFESLWTHAYICQKPVKKVQIINKHFKTSHIYGNLEKLTLTALQDYQRKMLTKAGFAPKKLWIIKKNEIKDEEST